MTTRNNREDKAGLDFRLPPNITFTRQPLPDGVAYVFRDVDLGELGRLAVESTRNGETQISSEIAGDPRDPMTPRRIKVLDPLCRELTRILESKLGGGPGRATSLPVRHLRAAGQVPIEEVRCEECGKIVALLVFADGATDDGQFEDYARMMYVHFARHNVPAWIIGPELGGGPMKRRPANILKVWPQRAPMECLRPDEFNPHIEQLMEQHCRSRGESMNHGDDE